MGLLDNSNFMDFISSPAGTGLLSAAAGTMAGARRGQPWNTAGRGAIAGLTGYATARDDVTRRQQIEEAQKMQTLQRQQIESQLARQKEADTRDQGFRDYIKGQFTPGEPAKTEFVPSNPFDLSNPPTEANNFGNQQINTPAKPAMFGGKPVDPVMAGMLPFLEPKEAIGVMQKQGAKVYKPGDILGDEQGNIIKQFPNPETNKPTELARFIQERDALPPNHPARGYYDSMIRKQTTHQPGVSVSYGAPVAGVDAGGNPVFFQPNKTGGAPSIIPGVRPNDQGQTPENAGKIAMAQQAVNDLDTAQGLLFGKNGRLMNNVVWGMNIPGVAGMPGNTPARNAYSAIQNAVAAKLRLETGAAANQSEVENISRRFMPTPADTAESAQSKLNRLREFFTSSLSQTKGAKQQPGKRNAAQMSDEELLKALGE